MRACHLSFALTRQRLDPKAFSPSSSVDSLLATDVARDSKFRCTVMSFVISSTGLMLARSMKPWSTPQFEKSTIGSTCPSVTTPEFSARVSRAPESRVSGHILVFMVSDSGIMA